MTPEEALQVLVDQHRPNGIDWILDDGAFQEKFTRIHKEQVRCWAKYPGASDRWYAFYLRVRDQQIKSVQDYEMAVEMLRAVLS